MEEVDSQSMDINRRLRKFTWRIENFSSIEDKKLYSKNFDVGDTRWRLLIFPKGNRVDYLSIHVDVADSATLPYGWSRYAQFRLAVVNQIDRKSSITKVAQHEFNAKKSDWGFTRFLPLSEFRDPKKGYLVDDACLVEADISTDRTIDWESHEFIVEARSDKLKCKEADCGKAGIDNQKTLVTKTEETTTPSPAILAAPAVLSSPRQDKANSTNQNLPTAQSSSQSETIEPEDSSGKDMDTFFTSLESELARSNTVSSEEAKEALAKIEEALNMDPANFFDSRESSPLNQAFKILSNFDCSSTLTIEKKNQLLAMEENFKELPDRAAKAVQDKNLVTEKESVKLTLTRNLERSVIKFKEAKAEVKQVEQEIAALHEQVDEAQKKREHILAELKHIFKISKELKMELEALEKQLPEYEAKAKLADEEEKTVEAEWGRMKDFISSMCSFATTAPGTTNYLSDKTDKENTLNGIFFRTSEIAISCAVSTSTSARSIFKFGVGKWFYFEYWVSCFKSFFFLFAHPFSSLQGQCSSSSSTNYMSFTTNSDTLAAATTSTNSNVNAGSTTTSVEASVSSFKTAPVFKFASSGDPSVSVSTLSATSGEATEGKTQDTSSGNATIVPFGSTSAFPTSGSNIFCGTSAVTGTVSSTSGCTTAVVTSFRNSSLSGTSSNITSFGNSSFSSFVGSTFSTGTNTGNGIFSGTSATTDTGSSVFGGTSLSIASTGSSIFSTIPAITSTGSNIFAASFPSGASSFQFGGQPRVATRPTPPNPSPFQAFGSLEFGGGGSFSLGSGGGYKSAIKYARVRRHGRSKKVWLR